MNRFCERCQRVTVDGNLWCQEKDCPAEKGHPVFEYGDYLGDLKVVKLLRVWRTAALYLAERGDDKVLLKVAHENEDAEERLKREAMAFDALTDRPWGPVRFVRSFFPRPRPALPRLLPPYPVPGKRPYGEITFRGETKFYAVFEHSEGKFLSDMLLENPQMWHYHAAWIIIAIADALGPIAGAGKCHLTLTPDIILVDVDKEGVYRPLLMDLGFLVAGAELESVYDWQKLAAPAYTAPEVLFGRQAARAATPAADVYSLGAIFYEMLAGKPAFESRLRRDLKVREAVAQYRGSMPVGRPELETAGVIDLLGRAIAPTRGFQTVTEFGNTLAGVYGRAPAEKRPVPTRTWVTFGIIAFLLLVVFGVATYLVVAALMAR
jgi:serine/threonine protein kinase